MKGIDLKELRQKGWLRLNVPEVFAPLCRRQFSHTFEQVRIL